MDEKTWSDIARFAELVCSTLSSVQVQQRALPEFARLTEGDAGGIHLLDHRYRGTLATNIGAPIAIMYEFEELPRRICEYVRHSVRTRFPVHDRMIHRSAGAHRRSSQGTVLAKYGFEHCMLTPLIFNGRLVGVITVVRRAGGSAFTVAEQSTADRLARFVSLALTNAAQHEAALGEAEFVTPAASGARVQTARLNANPHTAVIAARRERVMGLDEALTSREIEVMELVSAGLTNLEIAAELSIALNTVKQHLKHVYHKLGVRSRLEAVRIAERAARLAQGL